jgi:hypothetical protein
MGKFFPRTWRYCAQRLLDFQKFLNSKLQMIIYHVTSEWDLPSTLGIYLLLFVSAGYNLLESYRSLTMRVQAVGIQRRSSSLMELCHATLPHCSSMLQYSTYVFRLALLHTSAGNNEASSFNIVTHIFRSVSKWAKSTLK